MDTDSASPCTASACDAQPTIIGTGSSAAFIWMVKFYANHTVQTITRHSPKPGGGGAGGISFVTTGMLGGKGRETIPILQASLESKWVSKR